MIFRERLSKVITITITLLALCFSLVLDVTPVAAATIEVTTTADVIDDDGFCSLREALWAARFDYSSYHDCEGASGADTITLPEGTYTLSSYLSSIYTEIIITGENPATTIIEASDCNPVAETCTHDYNVFWVESTGDLTLNNVTIRHGNGGNNGGGISNFKGNLTITNSILTENRGRMGGGILNYYEESSLTITDCTFIENITSEASESYGGAIYNQGTLTIANSTFSSNYARIRGGGIYNQGALTITNCTLSANSTHYQYGNGGGIYNSDGSATITNSTFSENAGYSTGGVYNKSGATINLINSIIANSITTISGSDCVNYGTISTNTNNLVEDGSCSIGGTNFLSGDPLLGPLGDNGGPTQTHALLKGSPAFDAGDDSDPPATDQRGFTRPQGSGYDIGAFEAQPSTADFIGSPTEGTRPLEVTFTNLSTGDYDICSWDFGDGGTSTNCNNPSHNYLDEGIYTVSLTLDGLFGEDNETKIDYITVEIDTGSFIYLPLIIK